LTGQTGSLSRPSGRAIRLSLTFLRTFFVKKKSTEKPHEFITSKFYSSPI